MTFKKGNIPWIKGLPKEEHPMYGKHHTEEARRKMSLIHKGQISWNKGLTKYIDKRVKEYGLKQSNEKNHQWKGDAVGIPALHEWIKRHKPKLDVCEHCKQAKPYDLANISQQYKRDVNDFRWLCRSCHMIEDRRINNLRYIGEIGRNNRYERKDKN